MTLINAGAAQNTKWIFLPWSVKGYKRGRDIRVPNIEGSMGILDRDYLSLNPES